MKPIDEWKQAWRFFSVQANAIGIALTSTYGVMFDQLKKTFPPEYMFGLTCAVFVIGIIGRLTSQSEVAK